MQDNKDQSYKVGIITDIHHGYNAGTKAGHSSQSIFEKNTNELKNHNCNILIDLGDRYTSYNEEESSRFLSEVTGWYNNININKRFLFGNHDLKWLSQKKSANILGCKDGSWLEDINEYYQFLYWNPEFSFVKDKGFLLNDSEIENLETILNKARKNVVIFSHFPLDCRPTKGNYYFDNVFKDILFLHPEETVKQIIEKSKKVVACVNGHTHWNNLETIDGIHYLTIPSLSETYMTDPIPLEAFGIMNLSKTTIELEIFGLQPVYYRLPVNDPKKHWVRMEKTGYAPFKEYVS